MNMLTAILLLSPLSPYKSPSPPGVFEREEVWKTGQNFTGRRLRECRRGARQPTRRGFRIAALFGTARTFGHQPAASLPRSVFEPGNPPTHFRAVPQVRQIAMAVGLLLTTLLVAAQKKGLRPSSDCIVTVTLKDGSTEPRDCFVMDPNSKDLKPGTKFRFESCTA